MEFFENQVGEFRNMLGAGPDSNPATPGSAVGSGANSALLHTNNHHPTQHNPMASAAAPPASATIPNHVSTPGLTAQHLYGAGGGGAAAVGTPVGSSTYATSNAAGAKRKSNTAMSVDDDESGQSPSSKGTASAQRSKRSRYISIACNECKRRKIKCNGETPCQRCGNLNLQCLYAPNCCSSSIKDSDEFKQMDRRVAGLQEQVNSLFNSLTALRSETQVRLAPIQDSVLPMPSAGSTPTSSGSMQRPELPPFRAGFRGPTSTHFSLDVAKKTLHKMGYSNLGDGPEDMSGSQDSPPQAPNNINHTSPGYPPHNQQQFQSPVQQQQQQPIVQQSQAQQPQQQAQHQPARDPLWDFEKDEIIRLCRLHEDEIGIMYPVVKIEHLIQHGKTVAKWMEASRESGYVPQAEQEPAFQDLDTLVLKLIMAMALMVEEHGNSEKATHLFTSLRPTLDRMLMSDTADVKTLPLLALSAGYRFFNSEEVLAWRVMGQVTRLCIELGLHRRDSVERIQDDEARSYAIQTFWTAYVLDRRWALGVGMPWSIPDEEIDPQLPYPDTYPFLVSMIGYSKLSAQVWKLVRQFDGQLVTDLLPSEIEDVDSSIKKWYTDLPKETQLELSGWEAMPRYLNPQSNSQKQYDLQRLQIWTYLRLNQLRIMLYTPILHTHSCIMENLLAAELVVQLAKNTIRYLSHLHNTTNIYRKMQVFYHQFLTSAIAVLFLASCHAPVNFSSSCRDEFYMALELVKDMSAKSFVSKRLWSTIKSLKEVAPRLGLAEDPHSTAALTMAGLATGHRHPSAAQQQDPRGGIPSYAATTRPPTSQVTAGSTSSPFPGTSTVATTPGPGLLDSLQNGHQISSEMSKIFEGYMGSNNGFTPPPGADANNGNGSNGVADDGSGGPAGDVGDVDASVLAGASVYQHFRDMF